MIKYAVVVLSSLTLLVCACDRKQRVCPEGSISYLPDVASFPDRSTRAAVEKAVTPATVEIRGETMEVDRLLEGPFCNDHLSGTIYVSCNIQIPAWGEAPRFFKDCEFSVAPGTTIYVAPHNDAIFMKGCACHTGELAKK